MLIEGGAVCRQRRDAERSLSTVRFRYPDSTRRFCSVRSPVNATMEIRNIGLQVLLTFEPSNRVASDRCGLLQGEEGLG